jgi:hypothetical protein
LIRGKGLQDSGFKQTADSIWKKENSPLSPFYKGGRIKDRSRQRMRKEITKKSINKDIEKANRGDIEVLEPVQRMWPFISFHYSYKEISSIHGHTHIRSKEKRYANGKLESQEFKGTLGGHVYDNMVSDMQRHFVNQMDALLKPFSMFLPFGPRDRKEGRK